MNDYAATPLDQLHIADMDPQDRIAKHFCVYELTRSDTASRQNIDNDFPGDAEFRAAVYLAREVLDRVREEFGSFTPNSVFRSQALEHALKDKPDSWTSTSQHTQGYACDIEIAGKPTLDLAQWAADNLPDFDQIICECYDPAKGPNSGWVHISLKPPGQGDNRRNALSYIRDPASGKYVYVEGLQASVA